MIVSLSESNLGWSWLGLACETNSSDNTHHMMLMQFFGMSLFITNLQYLDTSMTILVQFNQCLISLFFLKHEYPDIVNWYEELSQNFSEIVKFVPSIGKSVEGRDMPAVHITASSADALKIYFQCQIHASKSPLFIVLFLCWTV